MRIWLNSLLFLSLLILILLTSSPHAQTIIFSKKTITITLSPPAQIKPTENISKEDLVVAPIPKPEPTTISYSVDVRPQDFLRSEVISNNLFPAREGLLILFGEPGIVSVPTKAFLVSRDLIFITEDNKISEIMPFVSAESTTAVEPKKPAKILLQINGGDTTANNIQVGDKIIIE